MIDNLPNAHVRAEVLVQALPHMQRYDQEIVVIKYGGHAMGDRDAAENFAEDIVLLEQSGVKPIVVHGGGPQIGRMLDKLGIESAFADGYRLRPIGHAQLKGALRDVAAVYNYGEVAGGGIVRNRALTVHRDSGVPAKISCWFLVRMRSYTQFFPVRF